MLFNAAITNQTQPEAGPSFTGDSAGGLFPAIPLDIHQDHPHSVASPQLMQDTQGCLYFGWRLTM